MRFDENVKRTYSLLGCLICLFFCLSLPAATVQDAAPDPTKLRVSITVSKAPVEDALKKLFQASKLKFQIDPSVRGTVTADLQSCAFTFALDTLLGSVEGDALTYEVNDGVYRITTQPKTNYRNMAYSGVQDLIEHFWNGDAASGNVMDPVDWGSDPKARGWLWARATFICTLENLQYTTKDRRLLAYLATDWAYLQSVFTPEELVSVGKDGLPERMIQNTAHDDAGWACTMYLSFYRATKDRAALECAKRLFLNACRRWEDPKWSGALAYDDTCQFTSSYQTALILAGIRLYELTGSKVFWDRAFKLYNWMETTMFRPDGLYWWIYESGGPRKLGIIREACSDTFLGGNMAMGVIQARLFRDTGDDLYRRRALRTANALLAFENDGKGHYLNDRDAWANALFMGEWVREVLTLPGIRNGDIDILRRTARAVSSRARTSKGYYSGCWNGPAEGNGCAWISTDGRGSNGLRSVPEQLMVSSNTVNILVSAAGIEGRRSWLEPRQPPAK